MEIPIKTNNEDIYSYGVGSNLYKNSTDVSLSEESSSYSTQPIVIESSEQNILTVKQSGEETGDVVIGNYDGGQGIKWDQSAGTLDIQGGVSVDNIDIPDTTTADSFHVDTAGNQWIGCNVADFNADHDNASVYFLNDGTCKIGSDSKYFKYDGTNAEATSVRYLEVYTAGEDITAGQPVCLGRGKAVDSTDEQLIADESAYISQYYPDENNSGGSVVEVQNYVSFPNGRWDKWALLKFNLSDDYSNTFNTTRLYIKVVCGNINNAGAFQLDFYPITSAWNAGTVTWNTCPTYDSTSIGSLTLNKADGTLWKYIDITSLMAKIKSGVADEVYGLLIKGTQFNTNDQGYVQIYTETSTSNEPGVRGRALCLTNQIFRCKASDTAGDDQEYRCYNFIGFAVETITTGNPCCVQTMGIVDGLSGLQIGEDYYIGENLGTIAMSQNVSSGLPLYRIGRAVSSTKLMIDVGYKNNMISLDDNTTYTSFSDGTDTYLYIYTYFKSLEIDIMMTSSTYLYGKYSNQKQYSIRFLSGTGSGYSSSNIINSDLDSKYMQIANIKSGGIYVKYDITIANYESIITMKG